MRKELVVIGGGPAGIEAAREANRSGRPAVLISDGAIGGRAGWHSLLPSKVWLEAAAQQRQGGSSAPARDVLQSIAAAKQSWNDQAAAELTAGGTTIVRGRAVFLAVGSIGVQNQDGETIAAYEDATAIVATGSVPVFPASLKPDGKRVLAPRFLSHLAELPRTMIVVGAGATGCESAYLFNALGVETTWIVDQFGILPQMYEPAGMVLGEALAAQGVTVVSGQMVGDLLRDDMGVTAVLADGARYTAETAFVAVGRRPDLEGLNLAAAGVTFQQDGLVEIDGYGRSGSSSVYIVGDADGRTMTANKAEAQARIAVRHCLGMETAPFTLRKIVRPVFTQPQVAQVGEMTAPGTAIARAYYFESLKAHISGDRKGFLDLAYEEDGGRIRGAAAVGAHAADALAAAAVSMGGTVSDLAALYGAYPSISELPYIAARRALETVG
jgi:pyruvate/2-oxoglutarate dehydrogenase complex dihydrolipoamide dehydrogenase (E3) component